MRRGEEPSGSGAASLDEEGGVGDGWCMQGVCGLQNQTSHTSHVTRYLPCMKWVVTAGGAIF
jgi:hypothetical protein